MSRVGFVLLEWWGRCADCDVGGNEQMVPDGSVLVNRDTSIDF